MEVRVFEYNGQLVVESTIIAKEFEKEHKDILILIRKCLEDLNELGKRDFSPSSYFIESQYTSSQNKSMPAFLLTEKGFNLLVMGFTGPKAFSAKVRLVEEFERLKKKETSQSLSPAEFLVYQAQRMLDQERALLAQQKQLDATTNQVVQLSNTVTELVGGLGYVTVVGYATRIKKSLDKSTAAKLGKACTKLCKDRGLKKSEVNDERYGIVGSYPNEVVKEVFDAYYLIN